MPVRRRSSKRRADPIAEAEAWACAFHCQFDFFGDLKEIGLADQAAVDAAMPEAWSRVGRIFLDRGLGDGFNQVEGTPYVLHKFGKPT